MNRASDGPSQMGAVAPPTGAARALACLYAGVTLAAGYWLLGPLPAVLFGFGFVGGLVCWILRGDAFDFAAIQGPHLATLAAFVLHKVEERRFGFFPALSELTKVAIPTDIPWLRVILYAMAAAWLLIPWLVRRRMPFGYFLAWTFFISMGVTELAHFVLPLMRNRGYVYFPGMATAAVLAPLAWWGICRMVSESSKVRRS